ncbi:MAG: hypothetical protein H0W73_08370 [Bacteroidetes bacterium]|nr:hypothetical protein [Bacteroidota bacterium]
MKILLILLVPAIGFVGCKKSGVTPHNNCATETSTENTQGNKLNPNTIQNGDHSYQSTDIVGSGDDDRDGGDKPKRIGSK